MTSRSRPYIVGLTGGIGSGKSAAAERFGELGAEIVDTDRIAHELTAPGGSAIDDIRTRFGPGVITSTGALDRHAMRQLVFADPQARQALEAILHPRIRAESMRRCIAASSPYVVLAVPLLIESGHWQQRCDRVCVVDCPEALQIQRVMARSGLDEAQIHAIMATQASRATRLAAADDIIDNSGDHASLNRQIDALNERYLALAKA